MKLVVWSEDREFRFNQAEGQFADPASGLLTIFGKDSGVLGVFKQWASVTPFSDEQENEK